VKFDVKNDKSQHTLGQPEPGKTLVYVIQDIGPATHCLGMCVTTKVALDGAWVGANHHNSYFSFAVDPGERHLCAKLQAAFEPDTRPVVLAHFTALVHFTAEAGKVYYFRTRDLFASNGDLFDFDPIDSDQGKLFVASIPMSVSHPKK
jgi:hypothetical protein